MTSQGQTCVNTPILGTLRPSRNLRLIPGQRSSGAGGPRPPDRVHAVPRPVAARAGGAGRLVAENGRLGPVAAGRGLDGSGLPPYDRPMRLPAFSRSARIPLTGMAACLAAGLAAGPAAAAATWTIKPGGAVTLGLVTATIKDTTTAASITCKRGKLTGK